MSKYNIVSKSGKGNVSHQIYTIEYQVDKFGSDKFRTELYCLGPSEENRIGKYAWLEGVPTPHIKTKKDKIDFLEELKLFQRGSSYRKTHPILYSDIEELKQEKEKLQERLSQLTIQISDKIAEKQEQKLKEYQEKIDHDSLSEYMFKIKDIIDPPKSKDFRYKLTHLSNYFYIYDIILDIPVVKIEEYNGKFKLTSVTSWDVFGLFRKNL